MPGPSETTRALRQRLLVGGPDALSADELLALVLGRSGTADTLRALRERFGGLVGLARRSPRELARAPGLGPAGAARLTAAIALGLRATERLQRGEQLTSSAEVYLRFRALAVRDRESFWALALDTRNRVLRSIRVCEGTLTNCILRPSDVLTPLLRESAAAAIVLHNHPSGDPEPSAQDVELTRRLREAADLVGIRLLDHVIVAADGYTSLRERGYLGVER